MFVNRSKALFIANVLGAFYAVYLMVHFFGGVASTVGTEQIGVGIATALVMPHLILVLLSVMFGMLGFFLRIDGFNLTSGILYCVATVAFLLYFMFTLPLIVLSFLGYSNQKKMKT